MGRDWTADEFDTPAATVDVPVKTLNSITRYANKELLVEYSEDETIMLRNVIEAYKIKLACIRAELSTI